MCSVEQKPVFRELTGEDPEPEVTEIESLCMNCHSSGITRLLLTRIPYYKNVVIMSFSCEECGYENNEIQPGGAYAGFGVRWKLHVDNLTDMNRQVVKSDYTRVRIPELDFEIPAQSQKGEVTTVEGIVSRAISGLTQDQEARREQHPEAAEQIDHFVARLTELRNMDKKWTLELEDISGNCFIENPHAPRKDTRCERTDFKRTKEQNHALGIFSHDEVKSGGGVEDKGVRFEVRVASKEDFSRDVLKSETCSMEIPELELEVGGRALGGRFTTAEGLLRATADQLAESPGVVGDAPSLATHSIEKFVEKLNEVLEGKRAVTIILDDPAGNSYVQSLNDDDPSLPDDGLKITRYERSFDQNEELGLNDMKTEGFEQS